MQKNVTGQKLLVYAFEPATNTPKTGDAANITAYRAIDGGAVTVLGDTSASEKDATNAKGFYQFDLTQAETNGDMILFSAKSSTSGVSVIAVPAVVFTTPSGFADGTNTIATVTNLTNLPAITANWLTAAGLAADAVAEIQSGLATPASILTTALTEAYAADNANATLTQLLYMIWAFLSEASISGTTKTSKKLDGSTSAMTHTINSATQPTSITRAT